MTEQNDNMHTWQNLNRDRSWIRRQTPIDVKLSNYAGFYDTRCLWKARYKLQTRVQLQKGSVWGRIMQKTGMNNIRPCDIWGHHSTYFSDAGLAPNMDDNAENDQQVSQEQSILEPRSETSEGRFNLQTVNSGSSGTSQVSAAVTYPDTAICKDAQGVKDTTAEDIVGNVNFSSAGCQHGSEETDPKFKTTSNKINVSDHKVIGISEVNIIVISDSEDVEDFNGEVIEVKNDQSPAEVIPTVVSNDLASDSELDVSVVENGEIFGGSWYQGRQWEYTEVGRYYLQRPERQRGFEFSVMSYNVLAQKLLEDNRYLYAHSSPSALDWNKRKDRLLKEIVHHSSDVICLQEVEDVRFFDFFEPELEHLGYKGHYLKRTGDKNDGCATFYKLSKFSLLDVVEVPYQNNHHAILDRDNVGLIVRLKPLGPKVDPNRILVVSNTHLLFNPRRGDIKLAQLMLLLAAIDKCAFDRMENGSPLYQAVIMCGDFNSLPHSEIYKFLHMGWLDYEGLPISEMSGQEEGFHKNSHQKVHRKFFPKEMGITDNCQYVHEVRARDQHHDHNQQQHYHHHYQQQHQSSSEVQSSGLLQHHLRLMSVYDHWVRRHGQLYPEVTTHHGRVVCTVDYIFYGVHSALVRFFNNCVETAEVQEGHLCLLGKYGLLTNRDLKKMGSLPNRYFGSDHLSVIAQFLLT